MLMEKATEVRKEWSSICDSVIHDKPKFIKRTRDKMWFSNLDTMAEILEAYLFTAKRFVEEDGSITLSLKTGKIQFITIIIISKNSIYVIKTANPLDFLQINLSLDFLIELSIFLHGINNI